MKLEPMPADRPAGTSSRTFGLPCLLAVLLGLMAVAVLWPVTSNDFVNYDDGVYVQSNAQVQKGLTLQNIGWAFTHTVCANWHPLTMMSHMLDCQLYGLKPWGHHLTSLLFHAADTVLLFLLLNRLTGAIWRSAWVAAMFALHPVHIESVAWLAERKDVLSAFFGFLTLLFYIRYVRTLAVENPSARAELTPIRFYGSRDYWLACCCFALGLLSKPMLVTWPFVLLLLDFWPLGRLQAAHLRSLLWEKVPFFLLAAVSSLLTFLVQKTEGATQSLISLPFSVRAANAVLSYGRYLLKILWPQDLAIFYPYPKVMIVSRLLVTVIVLAGISALFWRQRRNYPFLLMGWLWFLGILVPVIGLVQVGSQSMADRYTYLPSVGVLILIGWGAYAISRRFPALAYLFSFLAVMTILFCAKAGRQQVAFWKNSDTLFRHALDVTVDNDIAQNNLAAAYFSEGRTDDAIKGFRETLRINPRYTQPHISLGNLLASKGLTNEAIAELQTAVDIDPQSPDAHFNLGVLLLNTAQPDKAADQFQAAIRLKPDSFEAHNNLASVLSKKGLVDQAIAELRESIREQPDYADAHYNLGVIYFKKGLSGEAATELQTVINLSPKLAPAHYYLGNVLLRKGQLDTATAQFQEAIRLQPDYALAHNKLGITLGGAGHLPEAIAEFREALRLKPDYAEANTNLAIALKLQAAGH